MSEPARPAAGAATSPTAGFFTVGIPGAAADWPVVRFEGADLGWWSESITHHAALYRETALIAGGAAADQAHVPDRLLAAIALIQLDFPPTGEGVQAVRREAVAAGHRHLDMVLAVPPGTASVAEALYDACEELDGYCASGLLLTLRPSVRAVEFRRWYLSELVRQGRGESALSWSRWLASRPDAAAAG